VVHFWTSQIYLDLLKRKRKTTKYIVQKHVSRVQKHVSRVQKHVSRVQKTRFSIFLNAEIDKFIEIESKFIEIEVTKHVFRGPKTRFYPLLNAEIDKFIEIRSKFIEIEVGLSKKTPLRTTFSSPGSKKTPPRTTFSSPGGKKTPLIDQNRVEFDGQRENFLAGGQI